MNREEHKKLSEYLDKADEVIRAEDILRQIHDRLNTTEDVSLYWQVRFPSERGQYDFIMSKQLSKHFVEKMHHLIYEEMKHIETPTLHN